MNAEMLKAARETAWAAQSAAEAAWWGLLIGGMAALGTLVAIGVTVNLANRSSRDQRHKEAIFLMASRQLLLNFVLEANLLTDNEGSYVRKVKEIGDSEMMPVMRAAELEKAAKHYAVIVQDVWAEDKIVREIESIKLSEFPSVSSFIAFSGAKISMNMAIEAVERYGGEADELQQIKSDLADIKEACDHLETEAADLAPGHVRLSPSSARAISLKSFPAWARTTWTGLLKRAPWARQ